MGRGISEKLIFTGGRTEPPREIAGIGRRRICCFTGHRPEKLPDGGVPHSTGMEELRARTETYIRMLMASGHDVFIVGMSRGFDLLAADILTGTSDIAQCTDVICALPYGQQYDEMRTPEERDIYIRTLNSSLYIVKLYDRFRSDCYKARNQLMVNCSSVLVGYLQYENMDRSGSAQTFRMAERAGLETIMIYGKDIHTGL